METIYFLQIPGNLYSFKFLEIYSIFPKKRFRGFTPLKNKIAMDPILEIGVFGSAANEVSEQGMENTVISEGCLGGRVSEASEGIPPP